MLTSEVIDRCFSEWLYPAGINRPAVDVLAANLNQAVLSPIRVEGRVSEMPRDTMLEIEDELIPLKSRTGNDLTALERGYGETADVAHLLGAQVRVNPKFSRVNVLNAVKAVIGKLYPWHVYKRTLYTAATFTTRQPIALPADARDVKTVRVRRDSSLERWGPLLQSGVHYDVYKDVSPRQLQLWQGGAEGNALRIVYAADWTRPATTASDLTATIGLPETVQEGLAMGAAGYLLQGRETPRLDIREIKRLLAQAGADVPVGATFNVGRAIMDGFKQVFVDAEAFRLTEDDPTGFEYVGLAT